MTDQGQNIVNKYSYEPFGAIESQTELLPQPFKYVGQYGVMAETNGLYYMRARYYDPKVGRFISEDPIGFEGGTVNLSEYVGNNPVNVIDPEGLSEVTFTRSEGKIYITPSGSKVPMVIYPAGNNTTNPSGNPYTPESHGPAPDGTFSMGRYIPTGNNPNSSLGVGFIPIILPAQVPLRPRSGVGLHSGRANLRGPKSKTQGCIRTTDDAMRYLKTDPPTKMTIQ